MYHHFTGLTSYDADWFRASRVELSSNSDESAQFGCIGHGWYSRGHFNTFTYLATVYYTNILRRNRTTFAFIVRTEEIARQINQHYRTRFQGYLFSSHEQSHKEEDMSITRRTFDVQLGYTFHINHPWHGSLEKDVHTLQYILTVVA